MKETVLNNECVANECVTIDELLNFTALNTLDEDAMALIRKVNSHVSKCAQCRDQLKAIQTIEAAFDELYASISKEAEATADAEHPDFD